MTDPTQLDGSGDMRDACENHGGTGSPSECVVCRPNGSRDALRTCKVCHAAPVNGGCQAPGCPSEARETGTCPSAGGCSSCPDPFYCAELRVEVENG